MKKFLSLIIILVSLTTSFYAYAEDALFRGIPWESKINEVFKKIKKEFHLSSKNIYEEEFTHFIELGDDFPITGITYYFHIDNLEVAGLSARGRIYFSFLPILSKDQKSYSTKDGKLIEAQYDCFNGYNSFDELENKLNLLYGSDHQIKYESDFRVWRVGDTLIRLRRKHSLATKDKIDIYTTTITYTYVSDQVLSEARIYQSIKDREYEEKWKKEQEEEERKKQEYMNNTDGL